MTVELATYLADLVATNPDGSAKLKEADDHIRLLKQVLQNTFPGATGPLPISGDWTPEWWDDRLAAGTQTYGVQVGRYHKIGNMVWINGRIQLTGNGDLGVSDRMRLGGLPFLARNNDLAGNVCFTEGQSMAIVAGASWTGYVVANTDYIDVESWGGAGGSTTMLVAEIGNGTCRFFGNYEAQ